MGQAAHRPPTGRETAFVAVGQGALMVSGGVLALLVAQLFGKNTQTDAFFAAYAVYGLGLTLAQTFRLTAVPDLVRGGMKAVSVALGAMTVVALAMAVPMVILAGPLGQALVENDPSAVAPATLRILWIALATQLLAAMLATVLAVWGRFKAIGFGTLLVGVVSILTFLLLQHGTGIEAAAVGTAAGGLWLAVVLGVVVTRRWRPRRPDRGTRRAVLVEAGRLTFAASIFLANTVALAICVALATRQGAGEATLFSYAFTIGVVLLGITANVVAQLRSPALVAGAQRTARAAGIAVETLRFTLVLIGPVLAMTMLVGRPVFGLLLGSAYSGADIRSILVTLLLLLGWLLGNAAGIFAIVELLARGALLRLALLALALVVAVAGLAIAGGALAGIYGIAVALSIATLGATLVLLRWAFADRWRESLRGMSRAVARELAVVAVAFAPSAILVLLVGQTAVATALAAVLAVALTVPATYMAWPGEARALIGLFRRSPLKPRSIVT